MRAMKAPWANKSLENSWINAHLAYMKPYYGAN